jgi:hypothetical protein
VAEKSKGAKQGDRIEELDYVRKNNLTPDTQFYISNQIQNPVAQLFALCIEQMDGYSTSKYYNYKTMYEEYLDKYDGDEEEATLAVLKQKEKQLDSLMFLGSPVLTRMIRKMTKGPMDNFVVKRLSNE